MAGTLQTSMVSALDRLWTAAAVAATYNGVAVSILSDDFGGDRENDPSAAGGAMAAGTIDVKKTEVAAPLYRDPVVIDGVTYRVMRIESHDWYAWTLSLYRDERPGPGGRR